MSPANGPEPLRDVIVATHYWSPGWASAMDEYLRTRSGRYRWIGHPLFADGSVASYRMYEDGNLKKSFEVSGVLNPSRYLIDVRRTMSWASRDGPADLFVAGDNLLALAGLRLRSRGYVKTVVMYTIDYVPNRFANPAANALYHRIDRYASARVDAIWNTSSAIIAARRARDGPAKTAPSFVVPIGAHTGRIAALAAEVQRRPVIAYLGHLLEKQGVQVVVEAMPLVLARHSDARLLVIGDGPYRAELQGLARRLGVSEAIEFAGFMDNHEEIERRLVRCSVGVAPYVPGVDNYSQFQELPGKIVTYLASGLPVITTSVPRHGVRVESSGAGRVVDYEANAFAQGILGYLDDPAALSAASKAATKLGLSYDWDHIFDTAFAQTAKAVGGAW